MTYRARPGDVYLLCSDGLTTMLKEPAIAAIARATSAEPRRGRQAPDRRGQRGRRPGQHHRRRLPPRRLGGAVGREAARRSRTPARPWSGPAAEEAGLTGAAVRERRERRAPPRRAGRARGAAAAAAAAQAPRILTRLVLPVVVARPVAGGAVFGARQIYFVGTDSGGRHRPLPRPPLRPAARHRALLGAVRRAGPARARSRSTPSTRSTDHTLRCHDDAASLARATSTASRTRRASAEPKPQRKAEAARRRQNGGGRPAAAAAGGGKQAGGGRQQAEAKPKQGSGGGSK